MIFKAIFALFQQAFLGWQQHNAPRLGAALAYYAIFSLAPLLILVVAIVGLAFGEKEAQERIIQQAQGLVGAQGAMAIRTMIEGTQKPNEGIVASVVGIGSVLLGASGVVAALREALDTIWEVSSKPTKGLTGILNTIKTRFFLFAMVLGIGLLLLLSLVVSAGIAAFGDLLTGILSIPVFMLELVNSAFLFIVIALLAAVMYKVLPAVEIAWKDVWIGAALTSLLFTIGKFLFGIYLGTGAVGSAYGAAGTFLVILVWVYYSAQILFFGAEFTRVYALTCGSLRKSDLVSARAQSEQTVRPVTSLRS
jgi:membrane protein